MYTYEAMFIFRPGLSEEEQKKLISDIERLLKENQAEIADAQIFGKRRLAYEIEKCREGLYYLMNFTCSNGAVVAKLQHACNINDNIIRIMVVAKRPKAAK